MTKKYRAKQKKRITSWMSAHAYLLGTPFLLRAILPMLEAPPFNPLILTVVGQAASSRRTCLLAAALQPRRFKLWCSAPHLTDNTAFNFDNNIAINYNNNAAINFNNNAAPAASNPAISFNNAAGVQLNADLQQTLFMGPLSYQGPTSPAHADSHQLLVMDNDKGKSPLIELLFGQPVDDLLVRAGALRAFTMGRGVKWSWGLALTKSDVEALSRLLQCHQTNHIEQGSGLQRRRRRGRIRGERGSSRPAANNADTNIVPDLQVAADAASIAGEGDITFTLEEILGLDDDVMLPLEDGGVDAAAAVGARKAAWRTAGTWTWTWTTSSWTTFNKNDEPCR
uniref:Uncharacterized protein n=1 Tax=Leersia perrieri TaxID=77586 RepID=A0A0D9X8L9_9ORYZ